MQTMCNNNATTPTSVFGAADPTIHDTCTRNHNSIATRTLQCKYDNPHPPMEKAFASGRTCTP
eukprot:1434908-Pyramimonas_sp.AAC.1